MIVNNNISVSSYKNITPLKNTNHYNSNSSIINDSFVKTNKKVVTFSGKINFFKQIILKIFPEKIKQPGAEITNQVKKQTKKAAQKTHILPFNGRERMRRLGVKEENITKVLKAANGNKQHFYNMARLFKEGFHEDYISQIFVACKTGTGKVSNCLYNIARVLKEKEIPQQHIADIIKTFKVNRNFDQEAFQRFQKLKFQAYNADKQPKTAFSQKSSSEIDQFFYGNMKNILELKEIISEKNLLKLYNLDAEYIESITERITNLTEALKGRKKMVNLLKQKMNPLNEALDINYGLVEEKAYSPQAQTIFQDRIAALLELLDYSDTIVKEKTSHNYELGQMMNILNKLP